MSDIMDLEQLEEDIALLCEKRSQLLYEMGIEERYFVYNNRDSEIARDAWVLSSKSDTDKKVLRDISDKSYYAPLWNDKIKEWLQEEEVRLNPVVPTGEEDI